MKRRTFFVQASKLLLIPQGISFLFYAGIMAVQLSVGSLPDAVYLLTGVYLLYLFACSPLLCVAGFVSSLLSAVKEGKEGRPYGRYIGLAILHLVLEAPAVMFVIAGIVKGRSF